MNLPLLSTLIWLPIIGGILVLTAEDDNRHAGRARAIGLLTSFSTLVLSLPLLTHFRENTWHLQFVEFKPWFNLLGVPVNYHLGVDGISMLLIVLTTLTTLIVVLASLKSIQKQVSKYMSAFLICEGVMIGMFAAADAMLFYVFWEAVLIPMYLIIGIWGSKNRHYASMKFFLYTFLGSALMLVALLFLAFQANSFTISDFYHLELPLVNQLWLFGAFALAFGTKVPMWPVHTWLPDAHTEAPAGGSVVLAAVMLKMGGYGFLRFILPITTQAAMQLSWPMIILALIAVIYIGFVAIMQKDMKRLIAYSSISHMGFVTLGCFMAFLLLAQSQEPAAVMGIEGSMLQMIAHAFSSGALFIGVGIVYDKMHTRMINDYGGVATTMPIFAAFYMLFALANTGLPGTANFAGEFMIILASFQVQFWVAFSAALTLILGAAYTLWMYKRVFFGEVVNEQVNGLRDIGSLDRWVFALLAVGVLALGVYPNLVLRYLHSTVEHLVSIIG